MNKNNVFLIFLLLVTCKINASQQKLEIEELLIFGEVYAQITVCMTHAHKLKKYDQVAAFIRIFDNMSSRVDDLSKSDSEFFYKVVSGHIGDIDERSNKEISEMCNEIFDVMVSSD